MQITVGGSLVQSASLLRKYADIHAKALEICKRLCEVGEPIIRATHGRHATIDTEQTENGYKLTASGQDILFIEFGTGDMAGQLGALYDGTPSKVYPGSYSEKNAQMYSRYGFWVFGGHIYHYTEPHPAFYYAYKAMVEALPQIAQEVIER